MSVDIAPKISLSLGIKKPSRPLPTNGIKRPHAALGEGDDDTEDYGRAQAVSHFDQREGGAIDPSRPKDCGPLVIAPQSNRDWKEASKRNKNKRQRSGLPVDANQEGLDERVALIEAEFESRRAKFGLNVKKPSGTAGDATNDGQTDIQRQSSEEQNEEPSRPPQTEDERATDALLGKEQKSDLVLPAAVNEEEAFQRDFNTAPDMSTLADYDRVPVEQFGAALLRGMGWKDGEGIGAQRGKKVEKSKLPERRPALLGIGAKEEAAVAQEMGVWGKAAKGKAGEIKIYNPVLLRDKKTGEKFTEEEWEKRKLAVEREKYEIEFESKEREQRRREDKGDDRERGQRREKSHKFDERGYRDDKSRRHDDRDSDEEYFRRKEREARRRDQAREDDEYKRTSRKHEERYRDRSRDRSYKERHRR